MIKYVAFAFSIVFLGFMAPAVAQSEDEPYENELIYGINLNSNGGLIGGAFIRKAFVQNEKWLQFGGLEIVEVKHPKEYRFYNLRTGESFIRGKQNSLFVIRPHYGKELVIFRKAAESGVQVNAVGAIGPSLGLLAPYYIRYDYSASGGLTDVRTEQYDPAKHGTIENILSSAGFLSGLGESKLNFGLHTKAGLSFEYGRYNESITGVEVGVLLEAFPKEMIIIPESENRQVFTSVYLNIYYGRRK